jgi:hypothetical protein
LLRFVCWLLVFVFVFCVFYVWCLALLFVFFVVGFWGLGFWFCLPYLVLLYLALPYLMLALENQIPNLKRCLPFGRARPRAEVRRPTSGI